MLAAGPRQLRCARCGHGFPGALPAAAPTAPPASAPPLPEPPAPAEPERVAPAAAPPSAPPATDMLPPPAPPERLTAPVTGPDRPPPTRGPVQHSPIDTPEDAAQPPATGHLAAAWLASLALLGAGVAAVLVFHAEIAAAWPPAARFYTVLGLG